MPIEGNLQLLHLPEILQAISLQAKTGILTVQGDNDIVAVSFKQGEVVGADALNQTVEEGLGQVLASQGLVSPADFEEVCAEHEAGGKRLLDLLVTHEYVDRQQVLDALRIQTYQLLARLLGWEEGEFKFYSGQEVAYEEGFEPLTVEELLIRAVQERGDDGRPGVARPSLDAVYRRVDGPSVKIIGEDGTDPTRDPAATWLSPDEVAVLEGVDELRTAGEIAERTEAGDYKVLYVLYRLLRAGVVEPVAEPGETERPSEVETAAGEPGREHVETVAERVEAETGGAPWTQRLASLLASPSTVGFVVASLFVAATLLQPLSLLVTRPWSTDVEASSERLRRTARFEAIDRAMRTYLLLAGRFPDELTELREAGLLGAESLTDASGRRLSLTSTTSTYTVEPVSGGVALGELGAREAIEGDFLLDPGATEVAVGERPPLVLLD